jgi:hypothetical protein
MRFVIPAGRTAARIVRIARIASFAGIALFLGCSSRTPEQDLLRKTEPVGSWLAALQMTGEKWLANGVPHAFVRTTVEAAQKELAQADQEAKKSSARPEVRDHLRRIIAAGRSEGERLRHAAAAGDRRAGPPVIQRLAALHADYAALRKAEEPAR